MEEEPTSFSPSPPPTPRGSTSPRGQKVSLHLDSLAFGGDAVGRAGNYVFFVPFGIPGEDVEIAVTERKKHYGRGTIAAIVTPSADRIDPPCPLFGTCGGCQFLHMSYDAQIHHKKMIVENVLASLGKFDRPPVREVLGSSSPWHYRNKVQAAAGASADGRPSLGLYQRGSHSIVPMPECLIQNELNNRIIACAGRLLERFRWPLYDERNHSGSLRHIISRISSHQQQAMVTLVTCDREPAHAEAFARELRRAVPEISGIMLNHNPEKTNVIAGKKYTVIEGSDRLLEKAGNMLFSLSPLSFFQVNMEGLQHITASVERFACLEGHETLIDAYCGTGIFALIMSRKAGKIYGVEEVHAAVSDGLENVRLNKVHNVELLQGKSEDIITDLFSKGITCDMVLVDPPRAGIDRKLLESIVAHRIRRIIYVSCNPSTCARDARFLADGGYLLKEVQPIDMFPHTSQIEIVALLEYKGGC